MLMSYVQLTMLSADTVKLQSQLEELESENAALTAQYQRMFDMASVKEAAEAAAEAVADVVEAVAEEDKQA